MRFIRQEEIITTICNKEVVEDEYIIRLLKRLQEESIYFALSLKKMYHSDYNEHIITHNKSKVKKVNDNNLTVDFYIYKDSSLVVLKAIPFDEIDEIFALTKKNNLLECGRDKGFFDYIDLED